MIETNRRVLLFVVSPLVQFQCKWVSCVAGTVLPRTEETLHFTHYLICVNILGLVYKESILLSTKHVAWGPGGLRNLINNQAPVTAWNHPPSTLHVLLHRCWLLFFHPLIRKQLQLMMYFRTPPLRYHPPIAKRLWTRKGNGHNVYILQHNIHCFPFLYILITV